MVPHVRQRLVGTFGNFTEEESFETNQLDGLSLLLIQGCQTLLNDPPPFLKRQAPPRRIHGIRFRHFALADLVTVIETPEREVLPAAQAPVVRILQNPGLRTALGRVKLSRFVKNFKEHILHHIFGLAWITKNSQGNLQNEPVEAIEQDGQGVRMPLAHPLDHVFVGQLQLSEHMYAERGSCGVWDNGLVMHKSTLPANRDVATLSLQYASRLRGLYQRTNGKLLDYDRRRHAPDPGESYSGKPTFLRRASTLGSPRSRANSGALIPSRPIRTGPRTVIRSRASKVRSLSPRPAKTRACWTGLGAAAASSQPRRGVRPSHRHSRGSPELENLPGRPD